MRAVLQRVQQASVEVDGEVVGSIHGGLLVFLGVGQEDVTTADVTTGSVGSAAVAALADKVANLRIFADDSGRSNLSLLDTGGEALVVSQFTLYADTRRGRRPAFTDAAAAEPAEAAVDQFCLALEALGVHTASGRFGASMRVSLVNDGPYTIVLDTEG